MRMSRLFKGYIWPEDSEPPQPEISLRTKLSRLFYHTQRRSEPTVLGDLEYDYEVLTRFGAVVQIVASIAVIATVFYLLRSFFDTVGQTSQIFLRFLRSRWAVPLGTLLLIGTASALYLLRLRRRTLYGVFEFSFAVVVAWVSVGKLIEGAEAALIGVIQAAYLIVRGIDNIAEGRKIKRQVTAV
jgi:hypothetical protein